MKTLCRYGARILAAKTFPFLLLGLLFLSVPGQLKAAPLVSAHYTQSAGQEIMIEISIHEPPPATLIVIQNLPAEVTITQSQPEIKSVNSNKGEAKWLFTGVKTGNLALRLALDRPIESKEISGEIRYRDADGDMVSLPIAKP